MPQLPGPLRGLALAQVLTQAESSSAGFRANDSQNLSTGIAQPLHGINR